jgi:hypothetical protein
VAVVEEIMNQFKNSINGVMNLVNFARNQESFIPTAWKFPEDTEKQSSVQQVRSTVQCDKEFLPQAIKSDVLPKQSLLKRELQWSLYAKSRGRSRGRGRRGIAPGHAAAAVPTLPLIVPNSSLDLIMQGQWGNVFIILGSNLPVLPFPQNMIPITAASIDRIFAWDKSMISNGACRQSFVQNILDLLILPTGRTLIEQIVVKHHLHPGLSSVKFAWTPRRKANRCDWVKFDPCGINLEWNNTTQEHVKDSFVLVVSDVNVNQLNFIRVDVPLSIVLAHELGLYIYGLKAQTSALAHFNCPVVGNAVADATNHAGR